MTGSDGFARTTVALVPLVLLFVPLVAILLGITGQTAEAGADAFLLRSRSRASRFFSDDGPVTVRRSDARWWRGMAPAPA